MRKGQHNWGTSTCWRIQTLCTPLWKNLLMRANPLETPEEKASIWSLSVTVNDIGLRKDVTGLLLMGRSVFDLDT